MDISKTKSIVNACGVFILFFYSWIFQVIPALLFNIDVENMSSTTAVGLRVFSSIMLAITLFYIYRKDLISEWKKFKENLGKNFDIGVSAWFKGLLAMVIFNTLLGVIFGLGVANNEKSVQGLIAGFPVVMLLLSGVLAPWSEELVFRKSLRKVFKKRSLYIIVCGLLFGVAHVFSGAKVWTDWLFILPYGSLGMAFAASYYDTDTIFTPIMFHMIHNIILILTAIF